LELRAAFVQLMPLIPVIARVLADTNDTQQKERAVELWAMAQALPFVGNSQLFTDLLSQPMAEAAATLPTEVVAAAQARGQELDWWQTAAILLEELREGGWGAEAEERESRGAGEQGRFVKEELVATGGFGEVYRGRDMETGQIVVIKRLRAELVAQQPEALARFEREGELLRQLNHPNIVQMIASEEIKGKPCLIMEYVAGGSLRDLLDKDGRLSVARTLDIALELADALSRAHHLGIIHRDLKPGNVLLAEDGTPRLTDFGIARMTQQEAATGVSRQLTQAGALLGTVGYMSPEACRGEELDGRSDIWSFGVLLYEMLTGERPFSGEQITSTIIAILNNPVPDLRTLRPDVPAALVQLIEQMLVKDKEERLSLGAGASGRMRQVAAELDRIRAHL
jgi:serine/threonine protein kinase